MSAVDLQYPILDSGIRSINFFNGRLLTAFDLTREQTANREVDIRLGQAIGEGIAYGLEVEPSTSTEATPEAPIVTVKPGLAVNRNGQVLRLVGDPEKGTDVALVRQASDSAAASKAFTDCLPLQSGTYIAGAGVYLLTLAPAQSNEGKAPTNGLTGDSGSSCNKDATVTTVQFRLLNLEISDPPSDQNLLRNHIASRCFGLAGRDAFAVNPFVSQPLKYGLLDDLRDTLLTNCDVPLAILYWTLDDGIKFIDLWSVRRALTGRSYWNRWSRVFSERRLSESRAILLQFEDQIDDIRATEAGLASIAATQRFEFLPPAGILPVIGTGSAGGFNTATFFGDRASRDIALIDGNLVRSLLNEALYHEPIDLSRPDKIQLYSIWENVRAVEQGRTNQLALLFASHTLDYRGVTRFGYAKWSLSHFANAVI